MSVHGCQAMAWHMTGARARHARKIELVQGKRECVCVQERNAVDPRVLSSSPLLSSRRHLPYFVVDDDEQVVAWSHGRIRESWQRNAFFRSDTRACRPATVLSAVAAASPADRPGDRHEERVEAGIE